MRAGGVSALLIAGCGSLYGASIGIGDFTGRALVTTFDGLGFPDTVLGLPLVVDGNRYTTTYGLFRYRGAGRFDADVDGEALATGFDLDYIDVTLGGLCTRVGARVGGNDRALRGDVEFYGAGDVLLGTVPFGGTQGMVFIGWEDGAGITRVRFNDRSASLSAMHLDDFRFEPIPQPVADGGATFALLGIGLGLIGLARAKTA